MLRALQFAAIVLGALALAPGVAHLAALPNKIVLDRDAYFIAQSAYRGWALFGVAIIAALLVNIMLAVLLRRQALSCALAAVAALCLAATLGVFFAWTQPANAATANWTQMPENWMALRAAWEYSHAASALLMLLALCATTAATLTTSLPHRPAQVGPAANRASRR